MTGFVQAFGACIACKRAFAFNPLKVPSTTAVTGTREPVCPACMDAINAKRVRLGLPPFEIAPDAYDAAAEEDLP